MKINIEDVNILRVKNANYHLYEEMIHWRITGTPVGMSERKNKTSDPRAILDDPEFFVYAAEYHDRFIGWIHIFVTPKIGKWAKGHLTVDELWVAEDFRQNGVAFKLMQTLDEAKRITGINKVRLITHSTIAQKLYEKSGFEVVSQCVFMESNE